MHSPITQWFVERRRSFLPHDKRYQSGYYTHFVSAVRDKATSSRLENAKDVTLQKKTAKTDELRKYNGAASGLAPDLALSF